MDSVPLTLNYIDDVRGEDRCLKLTERTMRYLADDYAPFDLITDAPTTNRDRRLRRWRWDIVAKTRTNADPYGGIPIAMRTAMRRSGPHTTRVPITRAFAKMWEMCHHKLIRERMPPLKVPEDGLFRIACIAEAPGTFPIAIFHYLVQNWRDGVMAGGFHYHCSTLDPGAEGRGALTDMLGLIGNLSDKWSFGDLTNPRDIISLGEEAGAGSMNMVTGDIGKPLRDPDVMVGHSLWFEHLGQLMGACELLRDGGFAVLKMFQVLTLPTLSIIQLGSLFFEQTANIKPLASTFLNQEFYWVCMGFKRDRYLAMRERVFDLMHSAYVERHPPVGEGVDRSASIFLMKDILPRLRDGAIDKADKVAASRQTVLEKARIAYKTVVDDGVDTVALARIPTDTIRGDYIPKADDLARRALDYHTYDRSKEWVAKYPYPSIPEELAMLYDGRIG